jgi:hypothetical protein
MPNKPETGLILPVGSPSAKAIMLLRKLTPLSIAEIRQRAAEGRPITGFEDQDEYGIRDDEVLLRSVRHTQKGLLAPGIDAWSRTATNGKKASTVTPARWSFGARSRKRSLTTRSLTHFCLIAPRMRTSTFRRESNLRPTGPPAPSARSASQDAAS